MGEDYIHRIGKTLGYTLCGLKTTRKKERHSKDLYASKLHNSVRYFLYV